VLRAAGSDTPVAVVARRVHLSQGTVRNHLAAIATKLAVPTRAEAYRQAQEHGWL
jgi:two-component system response regulator DesR